MVPALPTKSETQHYQVSGKLNCLFSTLLFDETVNRVMWWNEILIERFNEKGPSLFSSGPFSLSFNFSIKILSLFFSSFSSTVNGKMTNNGCGTGANVILFDGNTASGSLGVVRQLVTASLNTTQMDSVVFYFGMSELEGYH